VLVGVGGLVFEGFQGAPVFAVVGGDVGALGPTVIQSLWLGVVGYGGAIAVGWGLGGRDGNPTQIAG